MRFTYGESGEEHSFQSPDELFPSERAVDLIIQYGQDLLDALPESGEQGQQLLEQLLQAGLVERDENGQLRLTPRMLRGIEYRALMEIFRDLKPGVRDGHQSSAAGASGERTDGTRAYAFGDPLHELDLLTTLRASLQRQVQGHPDRPASQRLPISIDHRDLHLHNVEAMADSAVCVLLDLSGSMARYGRHIAAKRVALGLKALMRRRFPLDSLDFISFASTAEVIREDQLPLIMPKPITTGASNIRVRVPLDQANLTHPHFTNLHHALQLARRVLARRGAANKQIFIITDGQPTAHLTRAKDTGVQMLNLIYPPAAASSQATLEEAQRCRQAGIRFATFALIEEYWGMDWVSFVEQLTRLTRGVAYYCAAGDLGSIIMESFLSGKKQRVRPGV